MGLFAAIMLVLSALVLIGSALRNVPRIGDTLADWGRALAASSVIIGVLDLVAVIDAL